MQDPRDTWKTHNCIDSWMAKLMLNAMSHLEIFLHLTFWFTERQNEFENNIKNIFFPLKI